MKKIMLSTLLLITLCTSLVLGTSDIVIDAHENTHMTFDLSGNVYYVYNDATPVLIGAGSRPSIDIDENNNPFIGFQQAGKKVVYATNTDSWTIHEIDTGDSIDIDVANGLIHAAYEVDSDGDGYDDVVYNSNNGGTFSNRVRIGEFE